MNYKIAGIIIGLLAVAAIAGIVFFTNGDKAADDNPLAAKNADRGTEPSTDQKINDTSEEAVLESGEPDTDSTVEETGLNPNEGLDRIPEFSLPDFSGNNVSLASLAGKNLVINSWAIWCPFCVDELPDFVSAQKEFGDRVLIIPIDRAESTKRQKDFLAGLGIDTNDLLFLTDKGDRFYRDIGGFSMPETLFVNEDGFIVEHKRGTMNLEEIRRKINNLLSS